MPGPYVPCPTPTDRRRSGVGRAIMGNTAILSGSEHSERCRHLRHAVLGPGTAGWVKIPSTRWMVDEGIGLMTNWGHGTGAKMQADRRTWMINANFVNRWARIYELRARTAFPAIGDTYDQLLPKGVRHTSPSEWDVEISLIKGLAGRAAFGRDEFLEVCCWKSSRSIVTAAKNTSRQIHSATARAFALLPSDPQGGARALLALGGVGVPVASALLAIARPAEATVLDIQPSRLFIGMANLCHLIQFGPQFSMQGRRCPTSPRR